MVDIVQIDHPILATELVTRLGTTAVEVPPCRAIVQLADFAPTKSARKANRKTANRLDADGRTWHFDRFDTDVPVGLIDSLVTLRRARDHASGRRSHLDDPRRLDFFLETIDDRLSHGLATIHTLTIDDELAAYVIGLRDQNVHRVWDGRVAVGFERYRAGIACTWRMREDAQADPSVDTLDWLRGINPGEDPQRCGDTAVRARDLPPVRRPHGRVDRIRPRGAQVAPPESTSRVRDRSSR